MTEKEIRGMENIISTGITFEIMLGIYLTSGWDCTCGQPLWKSVRRWVARRGSNRIHNTEVEGDLVVKGINKKTRAIKEGNRKNISNTKSK